MKILFVAANPLDTGRLALDEEMRAIERKVAGSPFAAQMEFVAAWAARPDDLLQAVNEHAPAIIHFAGHGSGSALELVGEDRRAKPVSHEAILRLIGLEAAASVRAVVLSACYSSELAAQIERRVGCAVGVAGRWGDEQASHFSSSFYRGLGFGATIREAVEQGCTSMLLEGFTGADDVRLHCDEQRAAARLVGTRARTPGPGPGGGSGPRSTAVPLFDEVEAADFVARRLTGADSAALTFIDVDGVLGINTVYGEQVGDRVIDKCAELVAEHGARRSAGFGYHVPQPAGRWGKRKRTCRVCGLPSASHSMGAAEVCRVRGDQFLVVETWTRSEPYRSGFLESRTVEHGSAVLLEEIQRYDWTLLARDLHISATGAIAHWATGEDAASLILRAVLGVREAKRKHKGTLAASPDALPAFDGQPLVSERERLTLRLSLLLS